MRQYQKWTLFSYSCCFFWSKLLCVLSNRKSGGGSVFGRWNRTCITVFGKHSRLSVLWNCKKNPLHISRSQMLYFIKEIFHSKISEKIMDLFSPNEFIIRVQTKQNPEFFENLNRSHIIRLLSAQSRREWIMLKPLSHLHLWGNGKHPSYLRNQFHINCSIVKQSAKASLSVCCFLGVFFFLS